MNKQDEMILDMLLQACYSNGNIDNACMQPYEDVCDYLAKKKIISKVNDRIYTLVAK